MHDGIEVVGPVFSTFRWTNVEIVVTRLSAAAILANPVLVNVDIEVTVCA
jgi:hypothetical protein